MLHTKFQTSGPSGSEEEVFFCRFNYLFLWFKPGVSLFANTGLMSHQQQGHTETGSRFKVSSESPKEQGIDLAIP